MVAPRSTPGAPGTPALRSSTSCPLAWLLTGLSAAAPGADMLCLTFFGHDWVHPVATEELAAVVDREQLGTGEGPCPESIRLRRTVRAELTEIRVFWPAFARLCRETGIRGFVVAPVLRGGSTLGTLSCYSRKPRSLGSSDERAVGFVAATISAMRGLVSQRV